MMGNIHSGFTTTITDSSTSTMMEKPAESDPLNTDKLTNTALILAQLMRNTKKLIKMKNRSPGEKLHYYCGL